MNEAWAVVLGAAIGALGSSGFGILNDWFTTRRTHKEKRAEHVRERVYLLQDALQKAMASGARARDATLQQQFESADDLYMLLLAASRTLSDVALKTANEFSYLITHAREEHDDDARLELRTQAHDKFVELLEITKEMLSTAD